MYIVRPITMETLWGDTRLHSYQGDRAAQTIGCVYTLSGIEELTVKFIMQRNGQRFTGRYKRILLPSVFKRVRIFL